jgi:hypothetical protein
MNIHTIFLLKLVLGMGRVYPLFVLLFVNDINNVEGAVHLSEEMENELNVLLFKNNDYPIR